MTRNEVDRILGEHDEISDFAGADSGFAHARYYGAEPDWLGNSQKVHVYFRLDAGIYEGRVTKWNVESQPRARPPWLNKTMNAVGL
jgi:hypothetical protein